MSEIYQIQLGSKEFVQATDTDEHLYVDLIAPSTMIHVYDDSSIINVAQLFNDERQASETYRFYGTINFISIINGLKKQYENLTDFFTRPINGAEASGVTRNVLNCFDFYLCRPLGNTYTTGGTVNVSGNTRLNPSSSIYQLKYQVLSNLSTFEIYRSGFAKNIFYDQAYSFNFAFDVDLRNLRDSFNKPITQLYLFANFNPKQNAVGKMESVSGNTYNSSIRNIRPYSTYNAGNIIYGDWVHYEPADFEEIVVEKSEHYVRFYCTDAVGPYISMRYNPFIPIKIREFGDEILSGNISGTSEIDFTIPDYAVKIDENGNYIWKNLLQNGYIDPISNKGVNYPFVNKRHYIFSNITLPLTTDLDDANTVSTFDKIIFGDDIKIYDKPTSDLNNLGNKC